MRRTPITQPVAIRLQEFVKGQGRTDIEIETEELHIVIEGGVNDVDVLAAE